MVLAATTGTPLLADDFSRQRATTDSNAQDATAPSYGGKLKCNDADNDGTAPYVLVDKWGMLKAYVQPQPGLDLQPYVDRQVWIESAGTAIRRDGSRCIKAGAVSLGDRPATAALHWLPYRQAEHQGDGLQQPVHQVAYEEPAAKAASERIPAPQPVPSSANGLPPGAMVPEPAVLPRPGDFAVEPGPGPMVNPGPDGPDMNGDGCGPACGPACGRCCGRCGCPVTPYWVQLDALLWWTKGMEVPPLVTTDTATGTNAGTFLSPTVSILAGGGSILNDVQAGGRLQLGAWLNDCGTVGIQGDYLALGGDSYNFGAWSDGTPTLWRPFYDTNPGDLGPNAEQVAVPGVIAGSVSVDARTWFSMAGVDMRFNLGGCERCWSPPCDPCATMRGGWRADLLLGYRFLQLGDRLGVTEELTSIGTEEGSSSSFFVQDEFDTKTQFDGGEIGLLFSMNRNRWSLELAPKIAFGTSFEKATVNGSTVATNANGVSTLSEGGLLAQATNIGNYSQNAFAVVPQFNLTLGYQLTARLEATFGYSFLYWSRVARAGDQIDFNVDDRNIATVPPPGGPDPKFSFNQTSFWAQGLNFGLGYRW
jgi:hypothetical protein